MPFPPEPSVLADLWLRLPPGNPDDVMERLREARVQAALFALEPLTRTPLVEWAGQDELDDCLATGDLAGLAGLYARLSPDGRVELVERVAHALDADASLAWLEASPDDAVARLVRAQHHVTEAWDGMAADGDEAAFAAATGPTRLAWAREECERAASLLGDDTTPWVVAQRIAVDSVAAAKAASHRWRGREPWHPAGHVALLHTLALHDVDEALVHARAVSEEAPFGHPVHLVVPEAVCLAYAARTRSGVSPGEADAVIGAHVDWVREAWARSLGHPDWRGGWLEAPLRNLFAFCLFFGDEDALAWRELVALHGHLTDHPWQLKSADAAWAYERARHWLVRHHVVGGGADAGPRR